MLVKAPRIKRRTLVRKVAKVLLSATRRRAMPGYEAMMMVPHVRPTGVVIWTEVLIALSDRPRRQGNKDRYRK
jgi:hypothetical protein